MNDQKSIKYLAILIIQNLSTAYMINIFMTTWPLFIGSLWLNTDPEHPWHEDLHGVHMYFIMSLLSMHLLHPLFITSSFSSNQPGAPKHIHLPGVHMKFSLNIFSIIILLASFVCIQSVRATTTHNSNLVRLMLPNVLKKCSMRSNTNRKYHCSEN